MILWGFRLGVLTLLLAYLAVGLRYVLSTQVLPPVGAFRAGIVLALFGGFWLHAELVYACHQEDLARQATAKEIARGAVEAVLDVGDDHDATVHQLRR